MKIVVLALLTSSLPGITADLNLKDVTPDTRVDKISPKEGKTPELPKPLNGEIGKDYQPMFNVAGEKTPVDRYHKTQKKGP